MYLLRKRESVEDSIFRPNELDSLLNTYFRPPTNCRSQYRNKSNTGNRVKLQPTNSIDLQTRNQQIQHGRMGQQQFVPSQEKNQEIFYSAQQYFILTNTDAKLTESRSNQNRASCRNIFNGFKRNSPIMMASASGFMNGGILKGALYKKLKMLKVHTTPKMAANSIKCCSDK